MKGHKTNLVNGVMAMLSLLAAFGIDVTEEQRVAILTFMATVVWPGVMFAMRYFTRGPMKVPGSGSTVRMPWWVVVLLVPMFWLGGCALYEDVPIDDTRDAILVANAELRGANFLLQDLIRAGAISRSNAQQAKDYLDEAHEVLVQALLAVDLHGDIVDAGDRLDQALVSLDLALALLAQYAPPPQAALDPDFAEAA